MSLGMLMNNPIYAGRTIGYLGNLSAYVRGIARVSAEDLGMPRAVPDDRKMDYIWRETFMPHMNTYVMELSYRSIESLYVSPLFRKFINLDKVLKGKPIPSYLPNRMMGSVVNSRSYYLVPDLIERMDIPEMEKKLRALKEKGKSSETQKLLQEQITEARQLAVHLRAYLNPEQYIDKHLLNQQKAITPQEAKILKHQLKRVNRLAVLFKKAEKSAFLSDTLQSLSNPKISVTNRLQYGLSKLVYEVKRQFVQSESAPPALYRKLSPEEHLKKIRKANRSDLQKLHRMINHLARKPEFQNSPFIQSLAGLPEERLHQKLFGDSLKALPRLMMKKGPITAIKAQLRFHKTTQDVVIENVSREILMPLYKSNKNYSPKIAGILQDLIHKRVNLAKMRRAFEGSGFWLKLPLSVFGIFIMYGLVCNSFDAHFIQPLQREVVKARGDSREILVPGYLSVIPGVAAFAATYKLPIIQRLGYIGSLAVSGAIGLGTFLGSASLMFMARLSRPRKNHPNPELSKPAEQESKKEPVQVKPQNRSMQSGFQAPRQSGPQHFTPPQPYAYPAVTQNVYNNPFTAFSTYGTPIQGIQQYNRWG